MKTWTATAKITGTAFCTVEAETHEEAMVEASASGDWHIDDWDLNLQTWNGGAEIEVVEEDQ